MRRLLVQLTDPHIGATWAEGDPVAGLRAAVRAVSELRPVPDAIVVTGDLVNGGLDSEYETLRAILDELGPPTYVLPGNHDDRETLRRRFGVPGAGAEPVQYGVDIAEWRLIAVDSTIPGSASGQLDAGRLAWLEGELSAARARPTVIALHHPPVLSGLPAGDRIGVPEAERTAFAAVLERHPQVRAVIAGHLHRTLTATVANRPVFVAPGVYARAALSFVSDQLSFSAGPPGFAVHLLDGERVISHAEDVTAGECQG